MNRLFATQQLAEILLKEAISIWRQGNNADSLEGIENDPVVSLIMTALAYQQTSAENDFERLKNEVLEEFSNLLIPYRLCRAVPANLLVQTLPDPNVNEVTLDSDSIFSLSDKNFTFIPLLKTKVFNAKVKSVVRMDARRWKVGISFKEPVSDIGGLSFLVDSAGFKDVEVSVSGKRLDLIKPWDRTSLPLVDCFSLQSMLYDNSLSYDASSEWFDLFSVHGRRLFIFDPKSRSGKFMFPVDKLDLVFEFKNIGEDFMFSQSMLFLNSVVLVNATVRNTMLTRQQPVARLSGGQIDGTSGQLMSLLRPSSEHVYYDRETFVVRKVDADRFSPASLLKLTRTLLDKYSSDYYAFQQVDSGKNAVQIEQITSALMNLEASLSKIAQSSSTYLILKNDAVLPDPDKGVVVNYLTTDGGSVNPFLAREAAVIPPFSLDPSGTAIIADPVLGQDEVQGTDVQLSMSRYYMVTGNRLVTPADIKIFCYNEMLKRHNIGESMIEAISVRNMRQSERSHAGFETYVEITLIDDVYVKRAIQDKASHTELVLQKMIESRSATVYPVHVEIHIP